MTKIILITPRLQHYRLTFYEKISNLRNDYQLIVFHSINRKEDGKASYRGETKFANKGFREFKFKIFPFHIIFNAGMYSELKKEDPEIIIMLATTGNITYRMIVSWAFRKKKKIVIWTSGWEPGRAKGIMLSFKNMFVSSFFKKADFFLTYSSYATEYVKSRGIDNSIIEISYNGIETDEMIRNSSEIVIKSKEIIKKFNLDSNITFLYVGGLLPGKRVDLLIDAFNILRKKYQKIKLFIIGDGPIRKIIEDKINIINDPNIFYLGRIIHDVDPFFVASDCFVLPGIGGLALNQAMFWGKPCIVSKADGTEDDLVIEDITGYRFIENDLGSLINAMERRIIEGEEKTTFLSKNSKKVILERSNVNSMVNVFGNTLDKLLNLINK